MTHVYDMLLRRFKSDSVFLDLRNIRRATTPVVLLSAVFVLALELQGWVPFKLLSKDPLSVAADVPCCHWYYGLLSNLGVMFWCAGAALSLFAAAEMRYRIKRLDISIFYLFAGVLSLVLMLDDLFQVHEVLPNYYIPESALFVLYGAALMAFIWMYRQIILSLDARLLLIAGCLLGISVMVDGYGHLYYLLGDDIYILEDGPKFVGIVAWACFQLTAVWFRNELAEII